MYPGIHNLLVGKMVFKNHPNKPTILLVEGCPNWDAAFDDWKKGKNPTDSKEWSRGVILGWIRAYESQLWFERF